MTRKASPGGKPEGCHGRRQVRVIPRKEISHSEDREETSPWDDTAREGDSPMVDTEGDRYEGKETSLRDDTEGDEG